MNPTVDLSPEAQFLADFNLQYVPARLGLTVSDAAAALMFGVDEATLVAYMQQAEQIVRETGLRLLAQPDLASALANWPLETNATVLALGDSITTYRYSYARLLATMLVAQQREDVRFINAGQSGFTSMEGLETTYTQHLATQPDWVLIMFGVNDAKQFGGTDAGHLVSLEAYRRNLAGMIDAFSRFSSARIVLLTPTPIVEATAGANPDFAAMRLSWRNAELARFAETALTLARDRGISAVDLYSAFGAAPDPALYLPDGLHPNGAGHEIIVTAVLKTLGGP